jgi:single-strand DNA-binding protein
MSVNLAVVRGHLTSPPEVRILPSERELAMLQITTRPSSEAISVPVAVWDPPAWLTELDTGAEVVAVGAVRRRFFRAGAATASRVELEATYIARAGNRRKADAARRRIDAALEGLDEPA